MKKVEITVLKTTLDKDLAKEYGVNGLGVCPFFKEGQVFVTDISKPDGFCDEAWKAISHYAFALSHGHTEPFFGGSWIENPEVAITCCNDGIRPVVFKMETVNE